MEFRNPTFDLLKTVSLLLAFSIIMISTVTSHARCPGDFLNPVPGIWICQDGDEQITVADVTHPSVSVDITIGEGGFGQRLPDHFRQASNFGMRPVAAHNGMHYKTPGVTGVCNGSQEGLQQEPTFDLITPEFDAFYPCDRIARFGISREGVVAYSSFDFTLDQEEDECDCYDTNVCIDQIELENATSNIQNTTGFQAIIGNSSSFFWNSLRQTSSGNEVTPGGEGGESENRTIFATDSNGKYFIAFSSFNNRNPVTVVDRLTELLQGLNAVDGDPNNIDIDVAFVITGDSGGSVSAIQASTPGYPGNDPTDPESSYSFKNSLFDCVEDGENGDDGRFIQHAVMFRGTPYEDVGVDAFYAQDATRLTAQGVLQGRSERMFAPNEAVTQPEGLKMLLEVAEPTAVQAVASLCNGDSLPDRYDEAYSRFLGEWFCPYYLAAELLGLRQFLALSPRELNPEAFLTRGQYAQLANVVLRDSEREEECPIDWSGETDAVYYEAALSVCNWGLFKGKKAGEHQIFDGRSNLLRGELAVLVGRLQRKLR